jgi:hypothetical protein
MHYAVAIANVSGMTALVHHLDVGRAIHRGDEVIAAPAAKPAKAARFMELTSNCRRKSGKALPVPVLVALQSFAF